MMDRFPEKVFRPHPRWHALASLWVLALLVQLLALALAMCAPTIVAQVFIPFLELFVLMMLRTAVMPPLSTLNESLHGNRWQTLYINCRKALDIFRAQVKGWPLVYVVDGHLDKAGSLALLKKHLDGAGELRDLCLGFVCGQYSAQRNVDGGMLRFEYIGPNWEFFLHMPFEDLSSQMPTTFVPGPGSNPITVMFRQPKTFIHDETWMVVRAELTEQDGWGGMNFVHARQKAAWAIPSDGGAAWWRIRIRKGIIVAPH